MRARQDGMPVKHAWSGIFHYCFDFSPHVRFVAMYRTFGAFWLVLLKGAFFKALHNVVQKLPALGTEPFFAAMLSMAEDLNHCLSGSAFRLHFWMIVRHNMPTLPSAKIHLTSLPSSLPASLFLSANRQDCFIHVDIPILGRI